MTYAGRSPQQIESYRTAERRKQRALRALARSHPDEYARLLAEEAEKDDGGSYGGDA